MKLRARQTVFRVDEIGKLPVGRKPLGGKQALPETVLCNRNIAQNDHGASTRGDLADFFPIGLALEAQGGRSENNPVLQADSAIINGTGDGFIHGVFHPLSVQFC